MYQIAYIGRWETIPETAAAISDHQIPKPGGAPETIVTANPKLQSTLNILMIDGASEAGHKLSRGTSGNILPSTALERKWQDYKYVKPIPTTARQENPNLTQNPKW